MYVLSWRTVSALTRVLFRFLFPSLLRNSGNKHQNNPLVSAETVRHESTYIILYLPDGRQKSTLEAMSRWNVFMAVVTKTMTPDKAALIPNI